MIKDRKIADVPGVTPRGFGEVKTIKQGIEAVAPVTKPQVYPARDMNSILNPSDRQDGSNG